MARPIAIFAGTLLATLIVSYAMARQYGMDLLAPELRSAGLIVLAVSAYVTWRVNGVLKRRANKRDRPLSAREQRVRAAQREREQTETDKDAPALSNAAPESGRSRSGRIEDRMAARRERVRLAKEKAAKKEESG